MRFLCLASLLILICSCQSNHRKTESDFMTEGATQAFPDQFPEAPRWVDDSENIFSKSEKKSLNDLSNMIFEKTGHIPMIHTTRKIEPYTNLNEYTSAIDKAWADSGGRYFIIIISDQLEEVRFVHGEITESLLPPDFVDKVMQNDLFPEFKTGNYARGVEKALNSYLYILSSI
jgi:uncharacterized protein